MNENYTPHPDYDALPEAIKATFTEKEYSWLSDEERNNLQRDMTMPDVEED